MAPLNHNAIYANRSKHWIYQHWTRIKPYSMTNTNNHISLITGLCVAVTGIYFIVYHGLKDSKYVTLQGVYVFKSEDSILPDKAHAQASGSKEQNGTNRTSFSTFVTDADIPNFQTVRYKWSSWMTKKLVIKGVFISNWVTWGICKEGLSGFFVYLLISFFSLGATSDSCRFQKSLLGGDSSREFLILHQ